MWPWLIMKRAYYTVGETLKGARAFIGLLLKGLLGVQADANCYSRGLSLWSKPTCGNKDLNRCLGWTWCQKATHGRSLLCSSVQRLEVRTPEHGTWTSLEWMGGHSPFCPACFHDHGQQQSCRITWYSLKAPTPALNNILCKCINRMSC